MFATQDKAKEHMRILKISLIFLVLTMFCSGFMLTNSWSADIEEPAAERPRTLAEDEDFSFSDLEAMIQEFSWTKGSFRIVPYGYLWGSAVYESERSVPGAYVLYVNSSDKEGEDAFVVDTRRTRAGLDIFGADIDLPIVGRMQSSGKLEIDLHGAFIVENKPGVLFRHAYGDLRNDKYRVLAGQTWDVVSPLYPGMLNYSVGWGGGNIGYRRAQMRAERYFALSDRAHLALQGSANQNIVSDFVKTEGVEPESSNWPLCEGRVALTLGSRAKGKKPCIIGVSGHVGEQDFDFVSPSDPPVDDVGIDTWSANLDVRLPITPRFGIQGELFSGENLGTFLGGIVQGVDLSSREGIRSSGGWAEIWYDWTPKVHNHIGFGIDDPEDEDISTGRKFNQFTFANISYDVTRHMNVGIEVSYWRTQYREADEDEPDPSPGESLRFEFAGRYGF